MLYLCPYPDCGEVITVLTNTHSQKHNLSKADLIAIYGIPSPLKKDAKKLRRNLKML